MLKNVPSVISTPLLSALMDMGHGDEIVIGDGNFPGIDLAKRVVYANGHSVVDLLEALLKVISLDEFVDCPVGVMATTPYYKGVPPVWEEFKNVISNSEEKDHFTDFEYVERYEFYERAKNAYAVVVTSEAALFANLIIKKGIL